VLAEGRLGAYQENKVVKLATPPDRRVIVHIDRALRAAPAPEPAAVEPKPAAEAAEPTAPQPAP
jgi:hypothetical protein